MLLRLLMHLFIAASVVAVVGGLGYVYVKPPAGMHVTSEGVPYLLAAGGAPGDRRGNSARAAGAALQGRRQMNLDLQTIAQLIMFCVAFGAMALAFFSDSL
ncbi:hypothetical protein MASR1M97_13230 [Candidatus Desulfobacillus denitrificans]